MSEQYKFVELEAITVHDFVSRSKLRVVVVHRNGAKECFQSQSAKKAKAEDATFSCESILELEAPATRLYLARSGNFKKVVMPAVPYIVLDIPQTCGDKHVVSGEPNKIFLRAANMKQGRVSQGHGVVITLTLGAKLTDAAATNKRLERASAAMRDALAATDTKQRMMEWLDAGSTHLSLLVSMGSSAADVFNVAQAVVGITQEMFQRISGIPEVYRGLQGTILDCNRHFDTVIKDARANFTSGKARRALDDWIALVVMASKEVHTAYSRSAIVLGLREIWAPRRVELVTLRRQLDQYKATISQAFLVEIKSDINVIKAGVVAVTATVDDLRAQRVAKEERELLLKLIPPDASLFNGKRTCLPGTRAPVLEGIRAWICDVHKPSRLFWLYGVAGCGKSTVAASICCKLGINVLGSFFCKRDQDDRRNPIRLIWSIAFFLAEADELFRSALLDALKDPKAFVNMDLASQFELVISKPLQALENAQRASSTPSVIVVDALDECDDHDNIARFLAETVRLAPWLLLVVTSRNFPGIAKGFNKLGSLRREYDLFSDNAVDDIRRFISNELEPDGRLGDIREFIEDRMDVLLANSQGLFIWVEVVVKFIADHDDTKLDVVDAILGARSHAKAESALDDLYRAVVKTAHGKSKSRETVKMIMSLVLATSKTEPLGPRALHALLPPSFHIPFTTFDTILRRMSAIFVVNDDGVIVVHTSVLDFIADEARCGTENYTPTGRIEKSLATGCFEIMATGTRNAARQMNRSPPGLRFNMCGLEDSYVPNDMMPDLGKRLEENISAEVRYSCLHWADHLRTSLDNSDPSSDAGEDDEGPAFSTLLADFFETSRSLYWLELLSLIGHMNAAREILLDVLVLSRSPVLARFTKIASEMRLFVEQCLPAISMSTPHLYISLCWMPVESRIWGVWKKGFCAAQILKNPIRQPSRLLRSIECPSRADTFAMSPDGTQVASGSRDGHVHVWNLVTGVLLHHQHGGQMLADRDDKGTGVNRGVPSMPIDAISYSPGGESLFCLGGCFLRELHSETLLPVREKIYIRYNDVRCMAVPNDLRCIALGLESGMIAVLDAKTYATIREIRHHTRAVNALAFSPDGSHLASAADDDDVCVWDLSSGAFVCKPSEGNQDPVCAVAFSNDGRSVVSGSWDRTVRLWDARTGDPIGAAFNADFPVLFLRFSPDSTLLVSALAIKQKWDYSKEGKPAQLLPSVEEARYHVRGFYSDEVRVQYAWPLQTGIRVWDTDVLARRQGTAARPGHSDTVYAVALSPDGQRIASGSWDCTVRLWDATTGSAITLEEMKHPVLIRCVAFSPDGRYIASGGRDKVVRIWDAQTGRAVRVLRWHRDAVSSLAYAPDGRRMVTGSWDGTVRLWDVQTGEPIGKPMVEHDIEESIRSVAFSPLGTHIASSSDDCTIRIWDGYTGEAVGGPLTGHLSHVPIVVFSPDGKRLASGGQDGTIRMWNVRTGESLGEPMRGHGTEVQYVAFTPDGTHVFSASGDRTIRCWDSVTGAPVGHVLVGHPDWITSVAVARVTGTATNEMRIVSGSYDKTIRVWDARALSWEVDRSLASEGLRGPERIPASVGEDGWVRTRGEGLLLWVPAEHRGAVCDMSVRVVSRKEGDEAIRIVWDKLCHGHKWTRMRKAVTCVDASITA